MRAASYAASVATRPLAEQLARLRPAATSGAWLHVSGCAKGCAHPGACDLTLVATGDCYDLIHNGTASDTPTLRGLHPAALPDLLKALHAPSL